MDSVVIEQILRNDNAEIKQKQLFFVYIIQGQRDFYYCGFSGKVIQRLQSHNQRRSKSTQWNAPYILKYIIEARDRKHAREMEKRIKNQGVKQYYFKRVFSRDFELTSKLIKKVQAQMISTEGIQTANSQQPTANT